MSPPRSALIACLALGTAACSRDGARAEDAAATRAPAVGPSVVVASAATEPEPRAPPPAREADPVAAPDADDASYLASAPRRGKSIGHTSVAFKLELSSGKKAVFKPDSRRGPRRYKGEIAAYRLGVALGLANVPPAYARSFGRDELTLALGGSETPASALLAGEAIPNGGRVRGALLPWIDDLAMLPLESEPLRTRWRRWLEHDGSAARDDAPLPGLLAGYDAAMREDIARQASTLVLFDYLTGNWDRWSGANVGFDRARRTILYIDNDGAFFATPPQDALARNERLLAGVDRFSRAFVARVRALDDDALARAIGEESPGVPLLDAKVLATVSARVRALLGALDAKIAARGEAETLAFP